MGKKLVAEFIGTFTLVFLAVGTAVVGIQTHGTGFVALAFGLVLVLGVYAFGPVSGCHINPAVTIGMVIARKMPLAEAGAYWAAQVAGAIVGAGLLKLMVSAFDVTDETGALGSNGYGTTISMGGAFVVEVVLTAIFVLVILLVTDKAATAGFAGLAIGGALTAIHLAGIPLTGTSVNPARSIGPALFAGGDALSQLWLFILAPLVGGALAAVIYPFTRAGERA
ncbi:MAG: MIP family channel protein [Actinomycetia bacterium]|jgi:aquaporin Z|nr:MIP family channel protein [Actinomycetes bacterium]